LAASEKETPLMRQYNALKAQYPGALLLFRVGDFYETFGQDAVAASAALSITLTRRANGAASEVALAGFPYHALDTYLPRLVAAGHRVAICDQLEDPKQAVGIVKRGVTELITPGLRTADSMLEARTATYLAAIAGGPENWGIAFLDASTGEFAAAEGSTAFIGRLMQTYLPAEVIASRAHRHTLEGTLGPLPSPFYLDDWVFQARYGYDQLTRHFDTSSLKGYGIEELPLAQTAAGAVLHYLAETEHKKLSHVCSLSRLTEAGCVWLDRFTIRNLELLEGAGEGSVPLIHVLDYTRSPMGSRLLRKWLVQPLSEMEPIKERLDTVSWLLENVKIAEAIGEHLAAIGDLERLAGKVGTGRVSPREMLQLKRALSRIGPIAEMMLSSGVSSLMRWGEQLAPCLHLQESVERMLSETPPALASTLGLVRDGYNPELDALRTLVFKGKEYLHAVQVREQKATGISSLKVAYNKVFGYYIEVTNSNKDKVPSNWIRKQTLVNAERYITEELKIYEEKIVTAESELSELEAGIWAHLCREAGQYVETLLLNARLVAQVDCLAGFARVAERYGYCRPELCEDSVVDIEAGRHPVIEQGLPPGEAYVPNSLFLDELTQQIILITGPNMSGKSALLRQTALIVLMAQCGSFVPAKKARLGIVDRIFTRVGASDNLSRGESTFMVEMTETASILNNLSERSLVLMDEIGRGTSTYDGISIAWAIVEHLHGHARFRPKTLFATHYHELGELAGQLERAKNYNVAVREAGDKVIFLRKLEPGPAAHSFGIHVAQMAGIPVEVVARAGEVLSTLEEGKAGGRTAVRLKRVPKQMQLSLFGSENPQAELVYKALQELDLNATSPIQALMKLVELKRM
jgi:DNA mismatch repair protein MutS